MSLDYKVLLLPMSQPRLNPSVLLCQNWIKCLHFSSWYLNPVLIFSVCNEEIKLQEWWFLKNVYNTLITKSNSAISLCRIWNTTKDVLGYRRLTAENCTYMWSRIFNNKYITTWGTTLYCKYCTKWKSTFYQNQAATIDESLPRNSNWTENINMYYCKTTCSNRLQLC